jgi:hypothetical protein
MTKVKLLNLVIGGVIITEDDEGNIISKENMTPVEVFNEDQANQVFEAIRETIKSKNLPEE